MITLESPRTNKKHELDVLIVGLGGAGSNVIDRATLDGLDKSSLVAMNTDIQSLNASVAGRKIQLGKTVSRGLGAGGDPELGFQALDEAREQARELLSGVAVVFICVGLGGGTGSGCAGRRRTRHRTPARP